MRPAQGQALDLRFLVGLSVLQLISWGSVFYGFSLFMVPIEQSLGLTRAESSVGFSLALLAEGLCAFWVGRWIDQGHEQRVMTGGSLLLGVVFVAHSQINDITQFYAAWLAMGIGLSATLYPPAFTVITRRFPDNFRRAIIWVTFMGGLASTVFIPLIAGLIDHLGLRDTLCVLGALHLTVCAPLHHHLLKNAPAQPTTHPTGLPRRQALHVHLKEPTFWLLGVFIVLMMMATTALPAHMVSLLREAGMAEQWALAIPALVGVLQLVGRLGLYGFEQRLNVHQTNRWMPCLIPLGFIALLVGQQDTVWALLFVVLYGLGNGMLTIIKGTAIAQYISHEHMGSLNGALGIPLALARASAPWIMGLLWSASSGYQRGLWWMTALSLMGIGALWWAQHRSLTHPKSAL